MLICFEDHSTETLRPISELTPLLDLVIGGFTQLERIRLKVGEPHLVLVRKILSLKVEERGLRTEEVPDEPALFVNMAINPKSLGSTLSLRKGEALISDGKVVAALLSARNAEEVISNYSPENITRLILERSSSRRSIDRGVISYPWDVCPLGLDLLKEDLRHLVRSGWYDELSKGVYVSKSSKIEDHVVFDSRDGPVIVEGGLEPFSYVRGPCFIGKGSIIFSGARIECSYLGGVVRAGGEISCSIMAPFSNNRHFGFLGHSYVSSWVNIGAGTATSNLKNTYGNIRKVVQGRRVDTGLNKLGCFMAPHSKLSIGTMILGGVFIGTASHVMGFVLEDVPPFTIYARTLGYNLVELEIDSAIRTYHRMARRRGVSPSRGEEEALKKFFEISMEERSNVKKGRFRST